MRPVWAEVDLAAVRSNVAALRELSAPAELCAVVKANGYGHGAVAVSRAALDAGASWLAVALVEEGAELRDAGIDAPILVLSEPPAAAMDDVVALRLTPTVYTSVGIEAAAKAAAGLDPLAVHLKVDTGMHRVGASPADAVDLAGDIAGRPELAFDGLWTHLAVADELRNTFTEEQLARFDAVRAELARRGITPRLVHAANSAGALAHRLARFDLVRVGVAVYGLAPAPELAGMAPLVPAMSLKARVSYVKEVDAGEGVSYGLRTRFDRPTIVATVPIGYADGVRRAVSAGRGSVLVGGRRCPIAGTVTMDQIMVDCGDDKNVAIGDEVVLIGEQAGETITADDWAEWLDTINYEVVCGIGPRVPRFYVNE